jgi:hypothetical protein
MSAQTGSIDPIPDLRSQRAVSDEKESSVFLPDDRFARNFNEERMVLLHVEAPNVSNN